MTGTLKAVKTSRRISKVYASMAVTALGLAASGQAAAATITPSTLPQLTTIDERFQSYNVEMAEVIGGNFWKPYAARKAKTATKPITSFEIGKDPTMFEKRAPVDLTNARLRKLAAALGPAYVRVSGTWANSVFFQDTDARRGRTDAFRLPERADAITMGRSYRLHPRGGRQACDLIRHQQRRSRR